MEKFDREAVFEEVDKSNKRFDTYTEEERRDFRDTARKSARVLADKPEEIDDE